MDVKPSNAYVPAVVPDVYQRSAPLLRRASHPSSAMSPDDIIDCVEIQTDGHQTTDNCKIGYGPPDKPRMAKGMFIDIWI